jgi:cytochrome b561
MQGQTGSRYSKVAMLLHWLLFIGVIVNWRLAETAHELPKAERGSLMDWHFTVGITILLLTLLRIVWRLVHRPPPLDPNLKPWERTLAHVTHFLFYVLLLALPLLGWIGISASGGTISFWGLFDWFALPLAGKEAGHEMLEIHETLGTAILWLIVLHAAGALKHTFWDKDGNLFRMLPFGPRPK